MRVSSTEAENGFEETINGILKLLDNKDVHDAGPNMEVFPLVDPRIYVYIYACIYVHIHICVCVYVCVCTYI